MTTRILLSAPTWLVHYSERIVQRRDGTWGKVVDARINAWVWWVLALVVTACIVAWMYEMAVNSNPDDDKPID